MKLSSLFGWGIAIYALLYLVWSGLAIYGIGGQFVARMIVLATLISVSAIATRSLRLFNERDVVPYAIGWVLIAALLDSIFIVPSAGWSIFTDWNLWVGYLVLLTTPLIVTFTAKKPLSPTN